MYRRKVIVTAAAVFALGGAIAAQTTSVHADRQRAASAQREPWVPGTNMLMSTHESAGPPLAPPR